MMTRRNGEPLSEHLARLAAIDIQRIRVHPDYIDEKGNVVVKPTLICGKDASDDIRPLKIDTTGRLDVVGVVPERQADLLVSEIPPTLGTKYTVLDTTELVRIDAISVKCNWTVQPTPLEIYLTADNDTLLYSKTDPVNNTFYTCQFNPQRAAISQYLATETETLRRAFFMEARSVKIEMEITGGTVSAIQCRLKWAKW